MTDLLLFRTAVREACRHIGRTQQQLARSIGLHPHVLSHKLNASPRSVLTIPEVVAIVTTLAEWGGVATRTQAETMMRSGGVPESLIGTQFATSAALGGLADLHDTSSLGDLQPDAEQALAPPLRPLRPPTPPTAFIGRGAEMTTVAEALTAARLVTITGAGGTGKTRLALQVAAQTASRFPDGVAFVDLALFADPALIELAILQAVGVPSDPRQLVSTQLIDALRGVRMLVILDNMEHLVDGSPLLGQLLNACPDLRFLVTSRIRLRLYGEHEVRLAPLSLPGNPTRVSEVRTSEAVELFVQRARAARPGYEPDAAELIEIGRICVAVGGIPLAVELVAARTRTWPLPTLLDKISDGLPHLEDRVRDRPLRHRTLHATLAWSEDLLNDAGRTALRRLGVFAGPFDPLAAAAVIGTTAAEVIDRLEGLEEQSLIENAAGGDGPRFRLLEPIRQYAMSRLADAAEVEPTRRAHLQHYTQLAAAMGPPRPDTASDRELDRLYEERVNIIDALAWAADRATHGDTELRAGLDLFVTGGRLWGRRSLIAVGLRYAQHLLQLDAARHAAPATLRAAALNRAAIMLCQGGDLDDAEAMARECLDLYESMADLAGMSRAYRLFGEAALARDDLEAADAHLRRQLTLARAAGDSTSVAEALNELGQASRRRGRYAEAEAELAESATLFTELGDEVAVASVLGSAGDLAFAQDDIARAARHQTDSLRLHFQYRNLRGTAYALEGCARVAAVTGRPADALRYVGAARRIREDGSWALPAPDRHVLNQVLASPVSGLNDAERRRAIAAGRRDDIADVVADALRQTMPPPDGPQTDETVIDLHRRSRREA